MICGQCQTPNDDHAEFCCMCGNDISPKIITLVGQNGAEGITVTIPPEGCKIGRQDDFETDKLFSNKWADYVGRHHCELFFSNGECYLRPLKTTNPTYAVGIRGGIPLTPFDEFKLTEGATVAFGAEEFAFMIHIERVSAEKPIETEKEYIVEMGWFITCEFCGHRHRANDEYGKIKLCEGFCDDDYDRRQIAQLSAKWERV